MWIVLFTVIRDIEQKAYSIEQSLFKPKCLNIMTPLPAAGIKLISRSAQPIRIVMKYWIHSLLSRNPKKNEATQH